MKKKISEKENFTNEEIILLEQIKDKEILPFTLLFKLYKNKYNQCNTIEEKKKIIKHLKISSEISKDYLDNLFIENNK